MLKLFLLSASLLSAQDASMNCSTIRTVTPPDVRGPGKASSSLKVSIEPDHGKNAHGCIAEYQLSWFPGTSDVGLAVNILTTHGEWDRKLTYHLDGFSTDGRRIFGTITEGGRKPTATLFEFGTAYSKVELFDITKALKQIRNAKCGTSAVVAGTTETGETVLASGSGSQRTAHWLLSPVSKAVHRLPAGKTFVALFK